MRSSAARLFSLVLTLSGGFASTASAAPLTVWNPSFESPAFADGGFDFLLEPTTQGIYGWAIGDGAYVYNPPAGDYAGAGGQGTPGGADGAQIGGIYQFASYAIVQRLAGTDGVPGSSDDPVLETGTVYRLTFAVGQRSAPNAFGTTWGGYDVQLVAGVGPNAVLIGQETNATTPPPGTFVERTIVIECPTFSHPEMIGEPLTILLRMTTTSSTADVDFDDVHLDATKISPVLNANFNETGAIDGADLALWKANLGATCLQADHGHGNADGDDYVDGRDLLDWQRQLGSTPASAVSTMAPEPATLALVVMTLLSGLFGRAILSESRCSLMHLQVACSAPCQRLSSTHCEN